MLHDTDSGVLQSPNCPSPLSGPSVYLGHFGSFFKTKPVWPIRPFPVQLAKCSVVTVPTDSLTCPEQTATGRARVALLLGEGGRLGGSSALSFPLASTLPVWTGCWWRVPGVGPGLGRGKEPFIQPAGRGLPATPLVWHYYVLYF